MHERAQLGDEPLNGVRVHGLTTVLPTLGGDPSLPYGSVSRSVSDGRSDKVLIKSMKEIENVLIRVL